MAGIWPEYAHYAPGKQRNHLQLFDEAVVGLGLRVPGDADGQGASRPAFPQQAVGEERGVVTFADLRDSLCGGAARLQLHDEGTPARLGEIAGNERHVGHALAGRLLATHGVAVAGCEVDEVHERRQVGFIRVAQERHLLVVGRLDDLGHRRHVAAKRGVHALLGQQLLDFSMSTWLGMDTHPS